MEKQEKSCGTIVVKTAGNDKKILIIRNKNGGHWSFPKGHVEKGESEYQTALRETKEETGLDVEIRRYVEPVSVKYSPKKGVWKEVLYFVADYKGGEVSVQQEEVSDYKWLSFYDAAKQITFDNEANALLDMREYIEEM